MWNLQMASALQFITLLSHFQIVVNSPRISSIEVLVHTHSTRNTIKLKMLSKEDYN